MGNDKNRKKLRSTCDQGRVFGFSLYRPLMFLCSLWKEFMNEEKNETGPIVIDISLKNGNHFYDGCQIDRINGDRPETHRLVKPTVPEVVRILEKNLERFLGNDIYHDREVIVTGKAPPEFYGVTWTIVTLRFGRTWFKKGRDKPILIKK